MDYLVIIPLWGGLKNLRLHLLNMIRNADEQEESKRVLANAKALFIIYNLSVDYLFSRAYRSFTAGFGTAFFHDLGSVTANGSVVKKYSAATSIVLPGQ